MPDPLLNRVSREQLSPELQAAWDSSSRIAGEAAHIEVMANHPALLRWYNEEFYGKLFANSEGGMLLDARSKELLRLRLSKGHGCHVCNSHNEITAREMGFSDAQIMGIVAPTEGLFNDKDGAVIDLAAEIELGNTEGRLSPGLYARLKRHYSDAEIVEMGMVAAFLTGMAKLLFTFDLVSRDEVCPIAAE